MVSFKDAVDHFQRSLSDLSCPKFCVRYYLYFIYLIRHDESDDDTPPITSNQTSSLYRHIINRSNIRQYYPKVFQELMNFLKLDRSRDEMRALREQIEVCSCELGGDDSFLKEAHEWHWLDHTAAPGKYPPEFHPRTDTLETLILGISGLLSTPVEESIIEMDDRRSSSARKWPNTMQDIIGSNPGQSIIMLCRWLDDYPSLQTVHLLAAILSSRDPTELITTALHSKTLPKTIVDLLNRTCETLPHGITGLMISWPLVLLTSFIRVLGTVVDGVSWAYFFDDQAIPAITILNQIARVMGSGIGTNASFVTMMSHVGGEIHEKLGLPYDPTIHHHVILDASRRNRENRIAGVDPFPTAQNILYILAKMKKCANLECEAEFLDSWQQCSGCGRVIYCSANCQRVDWSNLSKPHKKICSILKAVADAAGFPKGAINPDPPPIRSKAEFTNLCLAAGLKPEILRKMDQRLMYDNRIVDVLNDEFSLKYLYRLE